MKTKRLQSDSFPSSKTRRNFRFFSIMKQHLHVHGPTRSGWGDKGGFGKRLVAFAPFRLKSGPPRPPRVLWCWLNPPQRFNPRKSNQRPSPAHKKSTQTPKQHQNNPPKITTVVFWLLLLVYDTTLQSSLAGGYSQGNDENAPATPFRAGFCSFIPPKGIETLAGTRVGLR